jgi:hypothetical protein
MFDNYIRPATRPARQLTLAHVELFRTVDGVPEHALLHPEQYVIWDLPMKHWREPFFRVGEDQDAREARRLGIRGYEGPLPAGTGVDARVFTPYRKPLPSTMQRHAAPTPSPKPKVEP